MSQSSGRLEALGLAPINNDLKCDRRDTSMNPIGEGFIEPQMEENRINEAPVYSIICLLEAKLDGHKTWLRLPSFKTMEKLLNDNLIFNNPPVRKESRLGRRDDFVQQRSLS